MESKQYTRTPNQLEGSTVLETERTVDPAPLVGTWVNTNRGSDGIVKVIVANNDGVCTVHAYGARDAAPCDWGDLKADTIYADSDSSRRGMAFSVLYDFGFMETYLQGRVKQGVLVLANFTRFKDGSGRSNYFFREFYHRQ